MQRLTPVSLISFDDFAEFLSRFSDARAAYYIYFFSADMMLFRQLARAI